MRILLLSRGLGIIPSLLKKGSKIAFIPTAWDVYDNPYFVNEDREKLIHFWYNVINVDLTNESLEISKSLLNNCDTIFVAGGNTFYLLYQLKNLWIFNFIVDLVKNGKTYIGASAGAIITWPNIKPIDSIDDSTKAPYNLDTSWFWLVDFIVLPHYWKEKYLQKYEKIIDNFSYKFNFIKLKDDECVIVRNSKSKPEINKSLLI